MWATIFLKLSIPTDGLVHHLRASGLLCWMFSLERCTFILNTMDIPLSSRRNAVAVGSSEICQGSQARVNLLPAAPSPCCV